MRNSLIGLLLSFQFFTSLPIDKPFPMTPKTVTPMYCCLPILGLLMGSTTIFLYWINAETVQVSTLFLSILIVIAGIVMTGGLHLDGWVDMSDAYFSYQDRARRLEILDDSRVGAFGAISLVALLLLKAGLIYEALNQSSSPILFYFAAIPFLSRMAILLYFASTKTVKEKGMAAYFKSQVISKELWSSFAVYSILFCGAALLLVGWQGLMLFGSMLVFVFFYRGWTTKNFGGMTGDLVGALYEGAEVFLWGMLLFI